MAMAQRRKLDVISVTETAAARIRELLDGNEAALGVRVGVKNGGCAGMSYTLDIASEVHTGDERVDAHDVTVFVDPKAVLFLLGTRMDYEQTKLKSGFVFNNPNQVGSCGCGESVSLKAAEADA
jgi:iron-sulfur cluster assembly protein